MPNYVRIVCLWWYDYVWICLSMPEYPGILVNIPKSGWMSFVSHVFIVIPCPLECLVTYFNEYFSLKRHEDVFLKRQNLFFYTVAGSI